jgi:hypothetical protein
MGKKKVTPKKKPGPKPETLKVEGDWEAAVAKALKRGRPPQSDAAKPKDKKLRGPARAGLFVGLRIPRDGSDVGSAHA